MFQFTVRKTFVSLMNRDFFLVIFPSYVSCISRISFSALAVRMPKTVLCSVVIVTLCFSMSVNIQPSPPFPLLQPSLGENLFCSYFHF